MLCIKSSFLLIILLYRMSLLALVFESEAKACVHSGALHCQQCANVDKCTALHLTMHAHIAANSDVFQWAFFSIHLLQLHMIASLTLLTSPYFWIYRFCQHVFCICPTCYHSPLCQVLHYPIFPEFQVIV